MVGRVELDRLLVLLNRAFDVHLDGLIAFVREIDGLDVIAATTGAGEKRRHETYREHRNVSEVPEFHRYSSLFRGPAIRVHTRSAVLRFEFRLHQTKASVAENLIRRFTA